VASSITPNFSIKTPEKKENVVLQKLAQLFYNAVLAFVLLSQMPRGRGVLLVVCYAGMLCLVQYLLIDILACEGSLPEGGPFRGATNVASLNFKTLRFTY